MRSYYKKLINKIMWAFVALGFVMGVVNVVGLRYLEEIRVYQLQFEGEWEEYQRMISVEDVLKGISNDISAWQAGILPVDRLKEKSEEIMRLLSSWSHEERDEPGQSIFLEHERQEARLLVPAKQAFLNLTRTIDALKIKPTDSAVVALLRSLGELQATSGVLRRFYFKSIDLALVKAQKSRNKAQRDSIYFIVIMAAAIFGISAYSMKVLRRQAKKLMEQEREIASVTLVQHLAHEIRNPLGIVKSAASVIARRSAGDIATLAGDISSEVERVDELLTDLLHLRRGENKPKVPADISALVVRVTELFASKLDAAGMTLDIQNQAPGIVLLCQAEAIKQVVMNLLLNAIEASRVKGVIEIKMMCVGQEYILQVRDHGIGIEPGQQGKIFDLMYTTKPYGFGIGLTVVKGIVEDHGGRIEVGHPPPSGTAFTVYLPVRA